MTPKTRAKFDAPLANPVIVSRKLVKGLVNAFAPISAGPAGCEPGLFLPKPKILKKLPARLPPNFPVADKTVVKPFPNVRNGDRTPLPILNPTKAAANLGNNDINLAIESECFSIKPASLDILSVILSTKD